MKKLPNLINATAFVLTPLIPFLASGNWRWWNGWLYLASTLFFMLVSRAIALSFHPDLIRERATASDRQDTKGWDKILVPLVAIWLPMAAILIAGLDERFQWTPPLPSLMVWVGFGFYALGFAGGTWAMVVNRFFSSHVRLQTDRGQTVVSDGPYRLVRHPAYATGLLAYGGIPLLLDSLLAYSVILILWLAIVIRTGLEDEFLMAELPGYKNYAANVPFRLIPGIW